jgi:hypothetical protein
MRLENYDRVTGEFKVHEKGDEDRPALVDGRGRRYLNQYLARRPRRSTSPQLWVTEAGGPLSYWGAQSLMRRTKKRSGIGRPHAHLFRHGIAHRAADKSAHPGQISCSSRARQHGKGQALHRLGGQAAGRSADGAVLPDLTEQSSLLWPRRVLCFARHFARRQKQRTRRLLRLEVIPPRLEPGTNCLRGNCRGKQVTRAFWPSSLSWTRPPRTRSHLPRVICPQFRRPGHRQRRVRRRAADRRRDWHLFQIFLCRDGEAAAAAPSGSAGKRAGQRHDWRRDVRPVAGRWRRDEGRSSNPSAGQ